MLNWVSIPPTKIGETVFNEIDDENIYKLVDFTEFEESFKLKFQADSHAKEKLSKGNVYAYYVREGTYAVCCMIYDLEYIK